MNAAVLIVYYFPSFSSLILIYKPPLPSKPLYLPKTHVRINNIIIYHTMAYYCWSLRHVMSLYVVVLLPFSSVYGRPATFQQDFQVTWSDSHIRKIDGGRAIQLVLDQNSGTQFLHPNPSLIFFLSLITLFFLGLGCGFASRYKYLFGKVSMKIKLVPGDSAGTVTAFYVCMP